MADVIQNQLYKYKGVTDPHLVGYQILPQYSGNSDQLEIVDPSEYGNVDPALVAKIGTPSGYVLNNGQFTAQSTLDQQAQYEAAVAAGTMQKIPVGSGFGYVPTGSAAAQLSSGIANGTVSPTNPQQQYAASMTGNNTTAPGIVPQAPLTQAQAQTAATGTTTAKFYKPNPNSQQVYNAQGQPVSYEEYIAQGGLPDFSNVIAGNLPSANVSTTPTVSTDTNSLTGTPKTGSDIQSLIQKNQQMVQQYIQSMAKSEQEKALEKQLNDFRTQGALSLANIENKQIALPFIVGQQREQAKLLAIQEGNIIGQLQLAQEDRQLMTQQLQAQIQAGQYDTDLVLKLQALQQDEADAAKSFAQTNGITTPFYNVAGTIYRTSDGKAYSTPEAFFADGGARDFSNAPTIPVDSIPYGASSSSSSSSSAGTRKTSSSGRSSSSSTSSYDGIKFTATQLAKGVAASGLSYPDFLALPGEDKNAYINGPNKTLVGGRLSDKEAATKKQAITDALNSGVGLGDIRQEIDNSQYPQPIKEEFKQYAEEQAKALTSWGQKVWQWLLK